MSEKSTDSLAVPPPRLIPALTSGFNLVASNIHLILLPVILDLFLWIGPHFRLKTLLTPWVNNTFELLKSSATPDMMRLTNALAEIWDILLDRFNLASSIATFPIGLPSMIVSLSPISTPTGKAPVIEIATISQSVLLFLGFSLVGLGLGAFFFSSIARSASKETVSFTPQKLAWQIWQTTLLTVALMILVIVLLIPLSIIVSVFALINPVLAQIVLIILSFLGMWMIIPLVFCPHGIFMYQMGILASLMASIRLVRTTLPATGIFLLAIIVINQGMNVIWRIPPETSWMTLIGILGNAFISTALLAASFVYYRTGAEWLQEIMRHSTGLRTKV